MTCKFFTPFVSMTFSEMTEVGRFLESHLDEYADSYDNIFKAIQSAIKQRPSFGGFVIAVTEGDQIIGAIVINNTGMEGYAPQNLIVYLAVHRDFRRKGIGQKLLQHAIETAKGDIAIHLDPEQKIPRFYKKLGFQTAALELRLNRSEKNEAITAKRSTGKSEYSLHKIR